MPIPSSWTKLPVHALSTSWTHWQTNLNDLGYFLIFWCFYQITGLFTSSPILTSCPKPTSSQLISAHLFYDKTSSSKYFFSKNKFLPPVLWKPSLQCLPGLLRLLAILCPAESSTDPEFVSGKWILLRATCAHGHPLQCRSACPMQHSCTSAPSLAPPGSAIAKISVFLSPNQPLSACRDPRLCQEYLPHTGP